MRDDHFHGRGQRHGRADLDMRFAYRKVLQFRHATGVNDGVQITLLLGDPEADIGAAGEQCGARVLLQQGRQLGASGRRKKAAPGKFNMQCVVRIEFCERRIVHDIAAGSRQFVHGIRGRDNRPVTRAAAQVACQRIVDVATRWRRIVLVQREQRHDKARRTESALRTMAVHHRLLHRVQSATARGRLSTVISSLPSSVGRNWIQELIAFRCTALPLRSASAMTTVQAPQSPSAQPSLVPVRRRSSRRYCSTVRVGSTSRSSMILPSRTNFTVLPMRLSCPGTSSSSTAKRVRERGSSAPPAACSG